MDNNRSPRPSEARPARGAPAPVDPAHANRLRRRQIDRETPEELELHLIVDNYATHKHARVKAWLSRHPRFHLHFTPTGSSWLNMVERWFRELTDKQLRRGSFRSVKSLIEAIRRFIEKHNRAPKPFRWMALAEEILAKVERARRALKIVSNSDAGH